MAFPVPLIGQDKAALREHFSGSQEWQCPTGKCSPTEKKGVPLWLIAMAKGLWEE